MNNDDDIRINNYCKSNSNRNPDTYCSSRDLASTQNARFLHAPQNHKSNKKHHGNYHPQKHPQKAHNQCSHDPMNEWMNEGDLTDPIDRRPVPTTCNTASARHQLLDLAAVVLHAPQGSPGAPGAHQGHIRDTSGTPRKHTCIYVYVYVYKCV